MKSLLLECKERCNNHQAWPVNREGEAVASICINERRDWGMFYGGGSYISFSPTLSLPLSAPNTGGTGWTNWRVYICHTDSSWDRKIGLEQNTGLCQVRDVTQKYTGFGENFSCSVIYLTRISFNTNSREDEKHGIIEGRRGVKKGPLHVTGWWVSTFAGMTPPLDHCSLFCLTWLNSSRSLRRSARKL